MHNYLDILVIIGSLGAMMWAMMKFILKDVHKELGDIRSDIADLKRSNERSEKRIDHLYQICIEMLGTRHKH